MDFQLEVEVFCLFGTVTCACLIQVGSLRSPRQAHARYNLTVANGKSSADGCEVAAEPLDEPSHFSVGADIDFMDFARRFCFYT